jgi:hypothetical protein
VTFALRVPGEGDGDGDGDCDGDGEEGEQTMELSAVVC